MVGLLWWMGSKKIDTIKSEKYNIDYCVFDPKQFHVRTLLINYFNTDMD